MSLLGSRENESIVVAGKKDNVLKIVVTNASTETAISLIYRIFSDEIFGPDQQVFVNLHEFYDKAMFLESVAIRIASFCPNNLNGVNYTHDDAIAFKDADVVFCLGSSRGYHFTPEEFDDPFFEETCLTAKYFANAIEKYVKKDAKIIVLGDTDAAIISRYVKSISPKNITASSMFNLNVAAAHISHQAQCHPSEIKNLIVWGSGSEYTYPDCRYMYFSNKNISMNDDLEVWLRSNLPHIVQNVPKRSTYTRSLAFGMAEHTKLLWQGTPEGQWTCMGVLSDQSYGIHADIMFSYPVFCKDKQYEIVKDLSTDEYVEKYIRNLCRKIRMEIYAALKICGLN